MTTTEQVPKSDPAPASVPGLRRSGVVVGVDGSPRLPRRPLDSAGGAAARFTAHARTCPTPWRPPASRRARAAQ